MSLNRFERKIGMDLNGDGYIEGQGFMSRLERATHIDFNGDNIIGRRPDVIYGYPAIYGYDTALSAPRRYTYGYTSVVYQHY